MKLFAVETEKFAAIFVPIRKHPALDRDAVDKVVMRRRSVRMAMNEGGVTMFAEQIFNGFGIEIGEMVAWFVFALFGLFALGAQGRCHHLAFGKRSGQCRGAKGRMADFRTERLIVAVVGAQGVTMRKNKFVR